MNVFWIPIVAIVFSLSLAMLGMWTDHQRRTQKLEHLHRERMAAIEKGLPVPASPDADRPEPKVANPARMLRSGVLLLALGIVLYFAIDAAGGTEGALFGLIPATIGLANLAYAAALYRKEEKESAGEKARSLLPPL